MAAFPSQQQDACGPRLLRLCASVLAKSRVGLGCSPRVCVKFPMPARVRRHHTSCKGGPVSCPRVTGHEDCMYPGNFDVVRRGTGGGEGCRLGGTWPSKRTFVSFISAGGGFRTVSHMCRYRPAVTATVSQDQERLMAGVAFIGRAAQWGMIERSLYCRSWPA